MTGGGIAEPYSVDTGTSWMRSNAGEHDTGECEDSTVYSGYFPSIYSDIDIT